MSVPDPDGIEIEERPDGSVAVFWHAWLHTNLRTRKARARAILARLRAGGWRCLWCRAPIPTHRRADARFCRERCRKAHARKRRQRCAAEPV